MISNHRASSASFMVACIFLFVANVSSPLHAETTEAIIFESYVDQNWEICQVSPDGKSRKNLTNTPDVHELYPQASPDGSKLCFLVDEHRGGKILRSLHMMDVDGTNRKKISDAARHPAWSPDGKTIAFPRQEFKNFQIKDFASKGISFYDVETGKITQHPNEKIEHLYVLSWSEDGKWIVSTVHGGMGFGHAILGIEVAGNRIVDLKIPGCRPCLSRNGERITWSGDDHTIEVADIKMTDDGPQLSNRRVLFKHKTMHLYHPDLSDDGTRVTFSMGAGGRVAANGPGTQTEVAEMVGVRGPWDLYLKEVDSLGEPKRITFDESRSNKESEWISVQK